MDGHGRWQDSGSYRIVTKEGVLGLSDGMREMVLERLRDEERKAKSEKGGN